MAKISLPLIATGSVIIGGGTVRKVIVSTHSSGVIKLVDAPSGTSGRAILNDFTLASGSQILDLNLEFYGGVQFVLISGTATVQVSYDL